MTDPTDPTEVPVNAIISPDSLRVVRPTSRAPYRLRLLTADFPAEGSRVVEWRYRFSINSYEAHVRRLDADRIEHFVSLPEWASTPAIRDAEWSDEVARERAAALLSELADPADLALETGQDEDGRTLAEQHRDQQRGAYCECETPTIDLETEAGCHRCGLPIDFSPSEPTLSDEETVARERRETLHGAARGLVALSRTLHAGDGDPLEDVVVAVARSSGGPYALLGAIFRLLDSEETLDAARSLTNWSSYGTETQYAMMRRVARGVVGDANGARETFADILHATSERAECWPPVRLAAERADGLDSISERPSIYSARRAARAEAIAAGSTYDAASDAWSAATPLDHPKGGESR